jgi:hypothetical protein
VATGLRVSAMRSLAMWLEREQSLCAPSSIAVAQRNALASKLSLRESLGFRHQIAKMRAEARMMSLRSNPRLALRKRRIKPTRLPSTP